jgi:hypothetical protein
MEVEMVKALYVGASIEVIALQQALNVLHLVEEQSNLSALKDLDEETYMFILSRNGERVGSNT